MLPGSARIKIISLTGTSNRTRLVPPYFAGFDTHAITRSAKGGHTGKMETEANLNRRAHVPIVGQRILPVSIFIPSNRARTPAVKLSQIKSTGREFPQNRCAHLKLLNQTAPEIPSPSPPAKEEKAGMRRPQGSGGISLGVRYRHCAIGCSTASRRSADFQSAYRTRHSSIESTPQCGTTIFILPFLIFGKCTTQIQKLPNEPNFRLRTVMQP
jgi:hypothetical protein